MAYHLTRKWSKEKILTEYLNTIYFGNGAYGIESAARIYFGERSRPRGLRDRAATRLRVAAAARRGRAAGRHGRQPQRLRPADPLGRRDGPPQPRAARRWSSRATSPRPTGRAVEETAPPGVQPPAERPSSRTRRPTASELSSATSPTGSASSSSTATAPHRAFRSGWQVRTTLDLDLQAAAERRSTHLPARNPRTARPPRWSSSTTTRRGARDGRRPRLQRRAVQPRHPGPAPARLGVQAVRPRRRAPRGDLARLDLRVAQEDLRRARHERQGEVRRQQLRGQLLRRHHAGQRDDVLRQLGLRRGRLQDRLQARSPGWPATMGIRTPVSTNPAITLGGLKQGVTVARHGPRLRDVRHAAASASRARSGARDGGPGRHPPDPQDADERRRVAENEVARKEVFAPALADAVTPILPVGRQHAAPAPRRQYGGFAAGKTGTTENYGDAWFVGFTERYTVAVWVGYPDSIKSMETEYARRAGRRRHVPGADLARLHRPPPSRSDEQRERRARRPRTARSCRPTTTAHDGHRPPVDAGRPATTEEPTPTRRRPTRRRPAAPEPPRRARAPPTTPRPTTPTTPADARRPRTPASRHGRRRAADPARPP